MNTGLTRNGGFTLVELILVIAILAILAGVAVPAYSGYVQKANDTALMSELVAIHNAAQAVCTLNEATLSRIVIGQKGELSIYLLRTPEDSIVLRGEDGALDGFYGYDPMMLADLVTKNRFYQYNGCTWTAETGWDVTVSNK